MYNYGLFLTFSEKTKIVVKLIIHTIQNFQKGNLSSKTDGFWRRIYLSEKKPLLYYILIFTIYYFRFRNQEFQQSSFQKIRNQRSRR